MEIGGKWVETEIPKSVLEAIQHPLVWRMGDIRQLSFCNYPIAGNPIGVGGDIRFYPGANYPRIEHAMGTMLLTLLTHDVNSSVREEASEIKEEVAVAACVHDIGHPPFSHTIEHSPLIGETHEKFTYDLILSELGPHVERVGLDPEVVAQVATGIDAESDLCAISQLITGSEGIDRVAYLTKDSTISGERLRFDPFKIIGSYNVGGHEVVLVVTSPNDISEFYGLHKARAILTRKLYGSVQNRSGTTMLKNAFERVVMEGAFDAHVFQQEMHSQRDYEMLGELKRAAEEAGLRREADIIENLDSGRLFPPIGCFCVNEEVYEKRRIDEIRHDPKTRTKYEEELEEELRTNGLPILIDSVVLPRADKGETRVIVKGKRREEASLREWNPSYWSQIREAHKQAEHTFYVFAHPDYTTSMKRPRDREIREAIMSVFGLEEEDLDKRRIII